MSTVTQAPPEAAAPPAVDVGKPQRWIFANVVGSEWTKMRSVPSTVWSLLATIAITVGFGALLSWAYISRYDRLDLRERLTFDPTPCLSASWTSGPRIRAPTPRRTSRKPGPVCAPMGRLNSWS